MFSKFLPYCASGKIVKGFGRGSKSLGIPTANLPEDVVDALPSEFGTGIYYGWASLDKSIYKMVMSIGWNPFYKNEKKSMEVHLLHDFPNDLYDKELKVIITGYIRPEKDFSSVDELIREIKNDIAIAKDKLDEPKMCEFKAHSFLT
ncbi:riboflavin kinase [Belonocnema kinseyi]|uniref:riboflavin kinase n=1 Tax=Belonocnema kinseyi TaxID=2817044 RepID=UPI00143DFCB6|nr:riboflavin kinase [Belonocnema kinseyi]